MRSGESKQVKNNLVQVAIIIILVLILHGRCGSLV